MDRHRWYGLGLLALVGLALYAYLSATHQSLAQAVRSYFARADFVPSGSGAPHPIAAVPADWGAAPHALLLWHGHLLAKAAAAAMAVLAARWLLPLATRLSWSRELEVREIVLGPDDRAEPEEIVWLFDNLWGILQQVYAGSLTGAPLRGAGWVLPRALTFARLTPPAATSGRPSRAAPPLPRPIPSSVPSPPVAAGGRFPPLAGRSRLSRRRPAWASAASARRGG